MRIYTESGTQYDVDFDAKTITRYKHTALAMRRDGEVLKLISLGVPNVGDPLDMVIDIREDGWLTYRTTSLVTKIEE